MAKLSKRELAAHRAAVSLLERGSPLTLDQCRQVLEDWHEGAGGDQTASSAFFTPCDMANDLQIEMPSYGSFVDLCAGTGRLAYFAGGQWRYEPHEYERIVCVEPNPAYCAVGQHILPQAEWICGDALDPAVLRQIGTVDAAIMNPPFGATTKSEHEAPRYRGAEFDLKVMDAAATLAPYCWAIVPQDRARWDYRGDRKESKRADRFQEATGLDLWRFSSVDPTYHRDAWRGTSPAVEIVGFGEEFEEERRSFSIIHDAPGVAQQEPAQLALF
jgi:predicted RNA methylase